MLGIKHSPKISRRFYKKGKQENYLVVLANSDSLLLIDLRFTYVGMIFGINFQSKLFP